MKFPYVYLPIQGKELTKGFPIVEINLKNKDKKQPYLCLIDSGAEYCLFDAEIGESVGLDIKRGAEIETKGVNENAPLKSYVHPVVYELRGVEYSAEIAFTYGLSTPYGILGRYGFFDYFLVTIDEKKEEVELLPYS